MKRSFKLAAFLVAACSLTTGHAAMQRIVYVDGEATGPVHDGSSWCHAYRTLTAALASVRPGQSTRIRVAGGTYRPDAAGLAEPREASFHLVSNITIEGGFAGCGAAAPDRRDPPSHATVLSGDLNHNDDPGDPTTTRTDNAYHVVTATDVERSAVLEGLIITGGNATGPLYASFGGGVLVNNSVITVRNCVFLFSSAKAGGGAANVEGGNLTMVNCAFSGNSAINDGGAIFNDMSVTSLRHCTLAGNEARVGGGIRNYAAATLSVTSCILWDNVANGQKNESAQIENTVSTTTVNYSCLQGWTGTLGGVGTTGDDPLFVDPDGPDDLYGTADDNLRIGERSPCIDTGVMVGAPTMDVDGHGRPCRAGVDMGAYERGECPALGVTPARRFLAVAWNDPVSGAGGLRVMSAHSPWSFTSPPVPVGRDSILRRAGERFYAVSRTDGTITVVHAGAWSVERTHSLPSGFGPVDIAVVSSDVAYVTGAQATHLWRLDLISGTATEVVDLSAFADADGVPDLGMMALHEGRLFIQIRRYDSGTSRFVPPAYLAVVDVATEELVDVDPSTPGVQAITLVGTAPKFKMQVIPETRQLIVGATGNAFDSGGIEIVDLDLLLSVGLGLREGDGLTGADVGAFIMTGPERGFLVFTTDFALSSHLVGFSFSAGVDPGELYATVSYFAPSLEFNAQSGTLFFPTSGSSEDGVHVFDAATGTRLTEDPVATPGPPTDLVLFGETTTRFLRGNAGGQGQTDISDAIFILNFLFGGGTPPPCADAADANDSGGIDISDAVYVLNFLFVGGASPEEPFGECGTDASMDLLTCEAFPACS